MRHAVLVLADGTTRTLAGLFILIHETEGSRALRVVDLYVYGTEQVGVICSHKADVLRAVEDRLPDDTQPVPLPTP